MSQHKFQTEVSQLLHLIIHSLYSHKEIFLRELISNASDALDKLRYLTLTDEHYKQNKSEPRIDIFFNTEAKMLTIADTGIGMNEQELTDNLGTIARSGTRGFVEQMTGDARRDASLIGQFGVGFYSSFMVADRVEVVSRRAGEENAWKWESDGKGEFDITEAKRDVHGTTVVVHLNDEGKEFADRWRIDAVIKKYSNHIPFPIFLHFEESTFEGEGDKRKEKKELKTEQVNAASALWRRSKNELKDEDYKEFYKTISHDMEDPLAWFHTRAEGTMEYTTLFYLPKKAPFDLFRADYQPGVKLYVKRVFITDDEKELMPTYLRFLRGVIDSEDLPLNVSREILQQNRVLAKIKSASVKKVLGELETMQKNEPEKYLEFYKEFGVCVKEGLYSDFENKEKITELVMFKSTETEGFTSLAQYHERMKPDQNAIYYITGDKEANLRHSPLLEMYREKGIEVLLLDHEIDEIIITSVPRYRDIELKSVNRTDSANDLKTDEHKEREKEIEPLLKKMKEVLGDLVKDVKASARLSDSPSCIVADENDPTVQMQSILKMMGKDQMAEFKPILEVNPNHEIVRKLMAATDKELEEDISFLLYEQAMLIEGVELKSRNDFVKRVNRVMRRAL